MDLARTEHDGMTPAEDWQQTTVGKASTYSCGKCGEPFATPHEVYDHIDDVHTEESK